MSGSFFENLPKEFPQGLTVKELKEMIKDWPEVDDLTGQPTEVWVETGWCRSARVMEVWPLNLKQAIKTENGQDDVKESADLVLKPRQHIQ